MPLCYADGKLLRPLAPGAPLPETIGVNALTEKQAYKVIAPLSHGAAAIVAYNLYQKDLSAKIETNLKPEDYTHAGGMMQPFKGAWKIPEEGLVAFDWYEQKGFPLEKSFNFSLTGFTDRLFILCPVKDGWAVVGRSDKYLSPVAVESIQTSPNTLKLTLKESGPLVIYSKTGTPEAKGVVFEAIGNGFWKTELPAGKESIVIKKKSS
jgi:hypothetical protein